MMASEENKSSVIANLMSLGALPPRQQQQPVYRRQRVFSENYMQRVDSIGLNEKRSRTRTYRQKAKNKKNLLNKESCNGMQGLKSPDFDNQTRKVEERSDLDGKSLVLRPNLGRVKRESRPLFLGDSDSGWEFKKQLLERSKRTKVCQEIWSSKRVWTLGEVSSMGDLESKQRSLLGTRVGTSNFDGWKDKSVTKLPILKWFNRSSRGNTKVRNVAKGDLRLSSVGRDKNASANSQAAEFSCSFDVSYEKALLCEERLTALHCIDVHDELTRSTGEAYQASPNSVLEPDNSSSSENGESVCADLNGLWMKLQILMSESEENQSSKSESRVLGSEDATERSVSVSQNTKPVRTLDPKESQQFSYLVNMLNEMGFHGNTVELDFERCTTNPMIFKTLEKKYEKQKSWSKADRRLLFDRINIGLTEVVWSKSLRRKMSNVLKRDVVEEELWNMLLGQEKEVNVDLSKNSVWEEPWLELRDEVDAIVVEIEAFLFNELVAELVAVW
ncbi:hypothetical protein M8C21_021416 [Ambrosia artemisiifolia]|uniref:DUF4378 domain-containing protein n=1 Tax=Ambrosia artemisiifolia TaxID=4212 RepID=A0AAD5GSD8_AMBAR|nr:hypothetical protein M8C21_021416 [Ambrosia artemisiifolia]